MDSRNPNRGGSTMLRPCQWRTTPSGAGSHPSRRDQRRFVPSLSGSASCLEDRVVLSGAGHVAHAVHHAVAHHGHIATAHSQHGRAATVTPVAVAGSPAPSSGSPATFSTTRTIGSGTVTVSPARTLVGASAVPDF